MRQKNDTRTRWNQPQHSHPPAPLWYTDGMDERQFSLRDVFWSITLIGIGLGCCVAAIDPAADRLDPNVTLWMLGGPLIGYGLFLPVRQPMLGALFVFSIATEILLRFF